jgi:hypothetical protein
MIRDVWVRSVGLEADTVATTGDVIMLLLCASPAFSCDGDDWVGSGLWHCFNHTMIGPGLSNVLHAAAAAAAAAQV